MPEKRPDRGCRRAVPCGRLAPRARRGGAANGGIWMMSRRQCAGVDFRTRCGHRLKLISVLLVDVKLSIIVISSYCGASDRIRTDDIQNRNLATAVLGRLQMSFQRVHSGFNIQAMLMLSGECWLPSSHIGPAPRTFQTAELIRVAMARSLKEPGRTFKNTCPIPCRSTRSRPQLIRPVAHCFAPLQIFWTTRREPMFAGCGSITSAMT
jgi:hypothetical protein